MRYPNRILPLGSLLAAFLILILPGIREIEYLIPTGSHAETSIPATSQKEGDSPQNGKSCFIDVPGESQPFILQQNPPLHVCGSEVRQHTTTPTDLQSRHILLFRTFYKKYIQNKSSGRHCCIPTDISFICSAECSCSRASFSLLISKISILYFGDDLLSPKYSI